MENPFTDQLLLTIMQEISHDAVLSLDPAGRITSWNQGAEELLGYTAAEVIGRHFEFMIPQDLRAKGEVRRLLAATEQHGFLRDYETRRLTSDGREIHVVLTRMRELDAEGNLLGSTAILRDVTARKKMEDELVRARTLAAIGEFAARIAHEVKNPLTGISSALSVLHDQLSKADRDPELFHEIQLQVGRIDRIIDDLLTFARDRPVDRQHTDLVVMLQRVLSMVEGLCGDSRIRLETRFPEEATIDVDPSMLEDCFFNLIQNAIDAVQPTPDAKIIVELERTQRGLTISVHDNGPGIDGEVVEKIFDPFFTTKTRGTGLGLPITRKHIESHGGTIRVESEPGSFTRFEIYLPADVIEASLENPPPESPS